MVVQNDMSGKGRLKVSGPTLLLKAGPDYRRMLRALSSQALNISKDRDSCRWTI